VLGAKPRDDIMEGLCTLHMGDKGRHFILFRATGTDLSKTIEVLRILHEAMDLPQHLTDK
jgi:toxin ParE1/3/4